MLMQTIEARELGRGRSGVVFKHRENGRDLARKVFAGRNDALHFAFSGTPNPYRWNEDAVQAAHYRRNVLAKLVNYWFGDELKVAGSHGYEWDWQHEAFALETEFIDGRPPMLNHRFSESNEATVLNRLTKKLRAHLEEAGFYGMLWQAGKGNPVALNNFLIDRKEPQKHVWIDLESGIPMPLPLNFLDMLFFYLPHSVRNRSPYFDDLDTEKLQDYLRENRKGLELIAEEGFDELMHNAKKLAEHQRAWKSLNRTKRSIKYRLQKNEITNEEALWYSKHAFLWNAREARNAAKKAAGWAAELPDYAFNKIRSIDYRGLLAEGYKLTISHQYRAEKAYAYLESRIDSWEKRGMMTIEQATYLKEELRDGSVGSYISHLGAHLAISTPERIVKYTVLPSLYIGGVIDESLLAAGMVWLGSAARLAYSLPLLAISAAKKAVARESNEQGRISKTPHLMASIVGVLPGFGILAYPAEALYAGSAHARSISQFIINDTFTMMGEHFPIWGGKNTNTEHFFNRLPSAAISRLKNNTG